MPPARLIATQTRHHPSRFSPKPEAATSREGGTGQVLFYAGRMYDGVEARRRGVTSLGWPKPKLKFELPGSGVSGGAGPAGSFLCRYLLQGLQ